MARKRRRTQRKRRPDSYPGWMWMIFGLAIGLSVAFAIYVQDRQPVATARNPVEQPASMAADLADADQAPRAADQAETTETAAAPTKGRFDFYDMLPNFEVVIPENETEVKQDIGSREVLKPGIYVLQAGSFTEHADADRRRAQLALQGIESRIQNVSIDDKSYHRVRIGPFEDLDKLNEIRNRLHQANIDVLRIRLGD